MDHACERCGTGAEQVGPLRLRRFRLPAAQIFLTLDDEVLVQEKLADRLRAYGIACLGDVLDARSGDRFGVFQLRPEATLPPFGPATRGITRERPCPLCSRDGHYAIPHEPYRFSYPELNDRLLLKDVLATYERFGTSALRQPFSESVFAAPVLVVGGRVAAALNHADARHVDLQPVGS